MATRKRGGAVRSQGAQQRQQDQVEAQRGAERQQAVREAERPTASPRADQMFVWDTTAAPGAARIHEVIVKRDAKGRVQTKSYSLRADQGCAMPTEHALQFLRDDAFIVSTSGELEQRDEHRIRPVKARTDKVNIIALTEDETIAEWSELSDEALVRRAHAFPSDRKPDVNASRAELVVFLTEASRVKKHDGDRLGDEGDLQGMGGDELDSLFGSDRRKGLDRDLPGGQTRVRPAPAKAS